MRSGKICNPIWPKGCDRVLSPCSRIGHSLGISCQIALETRSRMGVFIDLLVFMFVGLLIGFVEAIVVGVIASNKGREGFIWFFITLLWTGASNGIVLFLAKASFTSGILSPAMIIGLVVLFLWCNLPLAFILMAGRRPQLQTYTRRMRNIQRRNQSPRSHHRRLRPKFRHRRT